MGNTPGERLPFFPLPAKSPKGLERPGKHRGGPWDVIVRCWGLSASLLPFMLSVASQLPEGLLGPLLLLPNPPPPPCATDRFPINTTPSMCTQIIQLQAVQGEDSPVRPQQGKKGNKFS